MVQFADYISSSDSGCCQTQSYESSKTNTTKDYGKVNRIKNMYGGGKKPKKLNIKKQSEDKIIKNIKNLFKLKKAKQSKTE